MGLRDLSALSLLIWNERVKLPYHLNEVSFSCATRLVLLLYIMDNTAVVFVVVVVHDLSVTLKSNIRKRQSKKCVIVYLKCLLAVFANRDSLYGLKYILYKYIHFSAFLISVIRSDAKLFYNFF